MSTQNPIDLKKTVNLPSKDLPMKGNLTQMEPARLKIWSEKNLYQEIRKARQGHKKFLLHDGPPYANGKIHLGTAFNKILKDFVIKSRTMLGYDVPYIPGYDCHGLPIENKVEEELGTKKYEMTPLQIRRTARKFAEKHIKQMNIDFQRLGILGDWDNSYKTMDYTYQAAVLRTLGDFLKMGSVYRGLRPVHWSIGAQSALAEAELEYKDVVDPAIYVAFHLKNDPAEIDPVLAGQDVNVVIWTTTPWTLPANLGICFGPDIDYIAAKIEAKVYIVAETLLESVSSKCNWTDVQVLSKFKGKTLEYKLVQHPWIERTSLCILGNHVTLDVGTGCVHTAPGHGTDDFYVGKTYGLEPYCPVDSKGYFTEEVEHFAGLQVFDANDKIVELLKEKGKLLHVEKYLHSYPHCWRTNTPTIFRATPQWFISMDANNLRQKTLDEICKISWLPEWGQERMKNMFLNRVDWCISRQRAWGVPITALRCSKCSSEFTNPELMYKAAEIFEKEGADAWYIRNFKDFVKDGFSCTNCQSTEFEKETDILDVWFDSGTSWQVIERAGFCQTSEAASDVYLEGSDQYRGWFNSSLIISLGLRNHAPYKTVITHGYVVDGNGHKMSKKLGNVVEPQELINKSGADILRLWVASLDFTDDVKISDEILARVSDAYRKLRNTACYLVNNLSNFDPKMHSVPVAQLVEIDRWALVKTNELVQQVRTYYENYDFQAAYFALYNFCTVDLSSIYFDVLKDRLYTYAPASHERRSAQTTLHEIATKLTKLLAPLATFTTDEIWEKLPKTEDKLFSIHITKFPEYDKTLANTQLLEKWEKLLEVRSTVLKALEEARSTNLIGSSLEAQVEIIANKQLFELLNEYGNEALAYLFITSRTTLQEAEELKVKITKAAGTKCERCWHYEVNIGNNNEFPTVCSRCIENIELGWRAQTTSTNS